MSSPVNATLAALQALSARYPFQSTVSIVNNKLVDTSYPGT